MNSFTVLTLLLVVQREKSEREIMEVMDTQRKDMMKAMMLIQEGRKQREDAQQKEMMKAMAAQRKEMMEVMEIMMSKKGDNSKSCAMM